MTYHYDFSYERYVQLVKTLNGSDWTPLTGSFKWNGFDAETKARRISNLLDSIKHRGLYEVLLLSSKDLESPPKTVGEVW